LKKKKNNFIFEIIMQLVPFLLIGNALHN